MHFFYTWGERYHLKDSEDIPWEKTCPGPVQFTQECDVSSWEKDRDWAATRLILTPSFFRFIGECFIPMNKSSITPPPPLLPPDPPASCLRAFLAFQPAHPQSAVQVNNVLLDIYTYIYLETLPWRHLINLKPCVGEWLRVISYGKNVMVFPAHTDTHISDSTWP